MKKAEMLNHPFQTSIPQKEIEAEFMAREGEETVFIIKRGRADGVGGE